VYAACRGYVVVFVVGKVWRIVPCVYKIYTLDRFQFHGLLKNNPIRCSGGGGVWMYVVRERCLFSVCWLGYPVSFGSRLFLFGFRPGSWFPVFFGVSVCGVVVK